MPPYLSPLFRLRLSALGEDLSTWGDPNLNNALKLIEEAVAGPITLTITGDRPLTSDNYISNEYRHGHHYLIGTPAADFTITIPPVAFPYRFVNRTGRQATIKTAAGTGVVVRVGMVATVLCDGTNCTALDPTLDKIQAPAANVAMAGFKLTGLADGTANGDAVTYNQVVALVQPYAMLASDWAQKTTGEVVSSSFTAYSARLWATSGTLLGSTGYKGAFGYAQDASTSATNAFNSATLANNWATTTGAKVDGNEYAAKEYAVGTTVAAGSAKTWATSTAVIAGGLKGAQGYAQDAGTSASNASTSATLAQSWATNTTTVSGGFKGARGYAQDAAASAALAAGAPITGVRAISTDYTMQNSDKGKVIILNGSATLTLPPPSALFYFWVQKYDQTGVWSIGSGGAPGIDGISSINCYQEKFLVYCDGANWSTQDRQKGWISLASVSQQGSFASIQSVIGFGDPELRTIEVRYDGMSAGGTSFRTLVQVKKGAVFVGGTGYSYSYSRASSSGSAGGAVSGSSSIPLTQAPFPDIRSGLLLFNNINSGDNVSAIIAEEVHLGPNASISKAAGYEASGSPFQGWSITPSAGAISDIGYLVRGYRP